jgi:hypothetical protein
MAPDSTSREGGDQEANVEICVLNVRSTSAERVHRGFFTPGAAIFFLRT